MLTTHIIKISDKVELQIEGVPPDFLTDKVQIDLTIALIREVISDRDQNFIGKIADIRGIFFHVDDKEYIVNASLYVPGPVSKRELLDEINKWVAQKAEQGEIEPEYLEDVRNELGQVQKEFEKETSRLIILDADIYQWVKALSLENNGNLDEVVNRILREKMGN